MKIYLDSKAQAYRDGLLDKAAKKKKLALKPVPEKEVLQYLKEILALLKQRGVSTNGATKFVVTERDLNGKVKSFKVES